MKVFVCNDHEGHWPVGTASVVVAENEQQAFALLKARLEQRGIIDEKFTLMELSLDGPQAVVLCDGTY